MVDPGRPVRAGRGAHQQQWAWMDEGLTTFVQYLAEQEFGEKYPDAIYPNKNFPSDRGPADLITDYMSVDQKFLAPIMSNPENVFSLGPNAYGKPATALNILRETIMGKELFDYAKRLGLKWHSIKPLDSGYRVFSEGVTELFVDYGEIGPSYIPGHAHSDTFNFVLNHEHKPLIVDPGISTYNTGYRRQRERSTSSHNTVRYGKVDQSEVWGGFRVGRRAKAIITDENATSIKGYHDGYKRFGVYHQRVFNFNQKNITIDYRMFAENKLIGKSSAYYHFYPGIEVGVEEGKIVLDGCDLAFSGALGTRIKEYTYAHGYNNTQKAKLVEVLFSEKLVTSITLKSSSN